MNMSGTIYKISCAKWGGWRTPVGVLLCFVAAVTAQPGFLSIDCGGKTDYTDENNIRWVSDADYIAHLGETADIGNEYAHLSSLRFFPNPLNKSCYHLPVDPHVPYLLRLLFFVGSYNYSGFQQMRSFAVSFETMGTLYMRNITITDRDLTYYVERILASSGTVLYICLIRTLESDDPFITAIESRKLQDGMCGQVKPGTILKNIWRTDVGGGDSIIRYPQDKFDRFWTPHVEYVGIAEVVNSSTSNDSNIDDTEDFPPPLVMQTAWLLNSSEPPQFSLGPFPGGGRKSLLLLYFAETQILDMSESRSFYVKINGEKRSETEITLPRNYSTVELTIPCNQTDDFYFALVRTSSLPPIINAFEYYTAFDTEPATYLQDIEALIGIKEMFNMTTWISDPCFLIPWNGISCHNNSSAIRISEITLSRRNLTGLVPQQIGQLTALVNLELHHNYLTGPLPDFSHLTMLERLHLQNNNLDGSVPDWISKLKNLKELALHHNYLTGPLPDLSHLTMLERLHLQNNNLDGSVPDWISELKNLKELFIENNNFSGEIPTQLLYNPSLNVKFSGNPYLSIPPNPNNIKSIPPNPNNKKLRKQLVFGITLGGVLIMGLSLIAGIFVYRKKKECITTESNGVENVVRHNEWTDATIMVPSSTKSCAFTLDQMTTATKNFSENIGKGGFGSVFFGKLLEGKEIAVKVLYLFSTPGIHQFLNEIDVLSRVHHENLVTLLMQKTYDHLREHVRGVLKGPPLWFGTTLENKAQNSFRRSTGIGIHARSLHPEDYSQGCENIEHSSRQQFKRKTW